MAEEQRTAVGGRGLVLIVLGAGFVVLAFRLLNWYAVADGVGRTNKADTAAGATHTRFENLRHSVNAIGGIRAASIYFNWLSWTLLIAVIALGALANVRTRLTDLLRILGFTAGAAGVGATYYALLQYTHAQVAAGATRHNPFFNGSWGLFAAFGGFGVAAVGAFLGPGSSR